MSIRTLAARGLSFAHLAGLSARGARAEGDEPEDEDKKDARRAEGDEPDEKDDDKEGAKGSRADDADDEYADDESDKKDDKAKGKKAKAAEDDEDEKDERAEDDDDEEMHGKSAVANARRRERARCAAIFASPAAARNPVLAANLAFKSRMTRSEAIAMLEGTPAPASASHAQRSARNPNLGVDGGAKPSPQQATAARWDANLKAANPSRR